MVRAVLDGVRACCGAFIYNVENIPKNRENVCVDGSPRSGRAPRLKPRVEPYGSKGMANGNKQGGRGVGFFSSDAQTQTAAWGRLRSA